MVVHEHATRSVWIASDAGIRIRGMSTCSELTHLEGRIPTKAICIFIPTCIAVDPGRGWTAAIDAPEPDVPCRPKGGEEGLAKSRGAGKQTPETGASTRQVDVLTEPENTLKNLEGHGLLDVGGSGATDPGWPPLVPILIQAFRWRGDNALFFSGAPFAAHLDRCQFHVSMPSDGS